MHKKTTNSRILVVVVKWRNRAIVLLTFPACEQAPYLGDIVKSHAHASGKPRGEARARGGGKKGELGTIFNLFSNLETARNRKAWKLLPETRNVSAASQRQLRRFLENKLLHHCTKTRLFPPFPPPLAARFAHPNAGELARRLSRRGWVHKWKCTDFYVCLWGVMR